MNYGTSLIIPDYEFKLAAHLPRSEQDLPRAWLEMQHLNVGRSHKALGMMLSVDLWSYRSDMGLWFRYRYETVVWMSC